MLDKVTWPLVALVGLILAAVCVLALNHTDTDVITNTLMLLGLGGAVGVGVGIKNNVNGNIKGLVDKLGSAMEMLANSTPTALPPPTPADDETTGG